MSSRAARGISPARFLAPLGMTAPLAKRYDSEGREGRFGLERTAFYFVFLLLGLVPGPALGQFATVRGRVVDASDGQPLQGVNLVVDDGAGARTGTATGADGAFVLARIPPGRYVLTASFVGYAT